MASARAWIGSVVKRYLILCGIGVHLLLLALLLIAPSLVSRGQELILNKLTDSVPALKTLLTEPLPSYSLDDEITANFAPWEPLTVMPPLVAKQVLHSKDFATLQAAVDQLNDGGALIIAAGVYNQALVINVSHIIIEGEGHVVLERSAALGKGAIVNKGDFNQISNIECRFISVPDRNGACVRHEGVSLKLRHVYFHDSEQGLLSGGGRGVIEIEDSRFERLGHGGQAHAIYVNGDLLTIKNSLIIAAKDQGHEVKSRAKQTLIDQSVIASLSSVDSRLIDLPNGGLLTVTRSVLQQGPTSANQDVIGYGLEGMKYADNQIILEDNIIVLERSRGNQLIHSADDSATVTVQKNALIATQSQSLDSSNFMFESRQQAGLGKYPVLPRIKIN